MLIYGIEIDLYAFLCVSRKLENLMNIDVRVYKHITITLYIYRTFLLYIYIDFEIILKLQFKQVKKVKKL